MKILHSFQDVFVSLRKPHRKSPASARRSLVLLVEAAEFAAKCFLVLVQVFLMAAVSGLFVGLLMDPYHPTRILLRLIKWAAE